MMKSIRLQVDVIYDDETWEGFGPEGVASALSAHVQDATDPGVKVFHNIRGTERKEITVGDFRVVES